MPTKLDFLVQYRSVPYRTTYMQVQARETVFLLDFLHVDWLVSTTWDWWEALQLDCTAGIVSAQVHVACHATKTQTAQADNTKCLPTNLIMNQVYHIPYRESSKLSAVGRLISESGWIGITKVPEPHLYGSHIVLALGFSRPWRSAPKIVCRRETKIFH